MGQINCATPGCTATIDTTMGCMDVTTLFQLRKMVEDQKLHKTSRTDKDRQLDYIQRRLDAHGVTEQHYQGFVARQRGMVTLPLAKISRLYLECSNHHWNYYKVDCSM